MNKNILLSICLALAGAAGFGASPAFGRPADPVRSAPAAASVTVKDTRTNPKNADSAQTQSQPGETLNQAKVHDLYNSGDFEPVIAVLEGFIQRNKTYSHSDSVFIAKHLAVVYSANPATREKGKYYITHSWTLKGGFRI